MYLQEAMRNASGRPVSSRRATLILASAVLTGCMTPESARTDADRVTGRIVEQAQQEALGRTEPIAIRSPEETLRRRLLLDQTLPVAAPVSYGTRAVTPIRQFPDPAYLTEATPTDLPPWHERARDTTSPLRLSLAEAVQIAARNSRSFQTEKEKVYLAALALDLERDAFRGTWTGLLRSEAVADLTSDPTEATIEETGELKLVQKFKNGMEMTAAIGLSLVRLITGDVGSSLGQFADATITIPLLRGAGQFVVAEPLRQSERDVIYAIFTFERFKQTFSVDVARAYLAVLEQLDAARNTEESYRRLITATRRARRLADAGRLPEIQVDQSRQDELRARDRWISTLQAHARRLDEFRVLLGLPPDAAVEPDASDLERMVGDAAEMRRTSTADEGPPAAGDGTPAEATAAGTGPPREGPAADEAVVVHPPDRTNRGPLELEERRALEIAIARRLDLRVAVARVDDAQRKVAVAADDLLPDLSLLGQASLGGRINPASAGAPDTSLDHRRGIYTGAVDFDPAFERTSERNQYRTRLIDLERAVRNAQEVEDQVKSQVRETLRTLLSARESVRTQERSLELARRRVESTNLFLQAGRAEIRDLLEAQESLVSAENARTSAVVRYRLAELEIQRDMGALDVTVDGLWKEFQPGENP